MDSRTTTTRFNGSRRNRTEFDRLQLIAALLALLVLLFGWATRAHAQVGEASIWGSVTDSTGAAVAGANVTLTDTENGATRKLVTDASGKYDAPALAVGTYEINIQKQGFRPEDRTGIALVVGQRREVTVALTVGAVQEVVRVQDTNPAVSVSTVEPVGLVGERQVKDLPLNGRSYDQLITLNPGIVNYSAERSGSIGTSNSVVGNMFAVSGRRPQENLFLLNGVEYTGASEIKTLEHTPFFWSGVVDAKTPSSIRMRIAYFPGWSVLLDGQPAEAGPSTPWGLLTFPVPRGTHRAEVRWGNTPLRLAGNAISLVSLAILLAGLRRR